MKAELVAAMMLLGENASMATQQGLTYLAARTQAASDDLAPILERAELIDELWAAAKAFGAQRRIDEAASQRLVDVCDKVAETETGRNP